MCAAILLVVGVLALLAWVGRRAAGAYLFERSSLQPAPYRVARDDAAAALGVIDVAFRGRDGAAIRGWYIPSRSGAAVVLSHGSFGDRRSLVEEAGLLAAGGFGVLLYDAPGRGESERVGEYGASGRAALHGALDFLSARADVDPGRIGAFGFSMGAHALASVAASDQRVRGVILAGAPPDLVEQTRAEYAGSGRAAQWGALRALAQAGLARGAPRPVDVVAAIAPRPLLVVAGAADATVPARLSRRLYDAAREPKTFWLIDGAGHGGYGAGDGAYGSRLRSFFTNALAPRAVGAGPSTPVMHRDRGVR